MPKQAAPGMDPERALIERAQAGDAAAFREIFRNHRSDVSRVVFRMIGPGPEIEDVVQEVFLHVYRSLPSFRGESRFSTWLYRLAVNVSRMHLRKGRSRPRFTDVEVPEGPQDGAPHETPDVIVERQERVRTLYRLLDQLSDKKREVLVMHDFDGVPAKEIAEIVGVPVLTVRTRLFYARKELYAAMTAEPSLAQVMEVLVAQLPGKPRAKAGEDALRAPPEVLDDETSRESRP
ncbi:RNA polymerase sigma factor RpoE [Sandaracinus amylolyticus]|uniref:RNA polymerase sigma factor RpoE n=2 Tax=Sandaracinus amylolyticus TaxID=927083 RepID=A0A0F6YJ17_9BACT|nr:RNA polymerase sigma factor RpoE [Sandaracinus amylolyticus]